MTVLSKRIQAGIALLDEQAPDWCVRIDLVTLNLYSSRQCVLGQVYDDKMQPEEPGFYIGIAKLGLSPYEAVNCAFLPGLALTEPWHTEWREAIRNHCPNINK